MRRTHDREPEASAGASLLRQPSATAKWWILVGVVVLLIAWQAASHQWMMGLPMGTLHRMDVLVGSVVTAAAVLAYLPLVQLYERRLAAAAQIIWELDQRLRGQMAARGERLLGIAQDLRVAERQVACRCAEDAAGRLHEEGGEGIGGAGDPLEALNASLDQLEELAREAAAAANLTR
jgi:hypothetical protein